MSARRSAGRWRRWPSCFRLRRRNHGRPRPRAIRSHRRRCSRTCSWRCRAHRCTGDDKVFPDAVPKAAPAAILAEYHAQRPESPEALRRFVASHFTLPSEASTVASRPERISIVTHIDELWDALTRRTPDRPGLFLAVTRAAAVRGSGRAVP